MGPGSTERSDARRSDADDPDVRPLSDHEITLFCNLLGVAPRQLQQARDEITERYDLGPRGGWIIGLLEIGVNSPSALTEALGIGRSLVTAEINRLLQAGLVTSSQNAEDGRRYVLALTAEGKRTSAILRAAITALVTNRLAGYSTAQIRASMALLRDFVGGATIGDIDE